MSVDFVIVDITKSERFDLGPGNWRDLFPSAKSFKIQDIADSESDLMIHFELNFLDKLDSKEECHRVAKLLWHWCLNKSIILGNTSDGVFTDIKDEVPWYKYSETGTRFG